MISSPRHLLFLLSASLALCSAQIISPSKGQVIEFVPVQDDEASCLTADSNTDGAAVYLAQCDLDLANRAWNATVGVQTGGPLTVFGNKCLDVKDGVDADGTQLQVWTCGAGNPNQQFFINTTDGTIRWNKDTTKCLDLTGGSITDGTPVQIWTCFAGDNNQQWSAFPLGTPIAVVPGGFSRFGRPIPAIHEDGCLTAGDNVNGADVVFEVCSGTVLQNWTLTAGSSISGPGPVGQLKIGPDNKCLDVTNGNTTDGTKLQMWDCVDGNTNQLWTVNGDTTIRWANSNPAKCVDLTNGDLANGTPIQIWDCVKFNSNQQWPGI